MGLKAKCVQPTRSPGKLSNPRVQVDGHAKSPHGCGAPNARLYGRSPDSSLRVRRARVPAAPPGNLSGREGGGGRDASESDDNQFSGKRLPDAPPQGRKAAKGPGAGLLRAPRPRQQSLETARKLFQEEKRRRRGACGFSPAAAAPRLPERWEAQAVPARAPDSGPEGKGPPAQRGSHARPESNSWRRRQRDRAPPARRSQGPAWDGPAQGPSRPGPRDRAREEGAAEPLKMHHSIQNPPPHK
ncbi:synapsin-1-like [Piliocolobus tephrosceles]|uniref:synapsin-1-like n=1 Tax=Piliocolobus tephrosceles TaxID=591936 RepID=UPI000C2A04FE|nr:synapsin-1-like [Piliocolobus tephrosceles]